MFTLIETWHADNGAWGNIHHPFETEQEAIEAAAACDETSTVEVKDANWQTVMVLCKPSEAAALEVGTEASE